MSKKRLVHNPAWDAWARQVNANYHDGGMSLAQAQAAAGPEPEKYIIQEYYETKPNNS